MRRMLRIAGWFGLGLSALLFVATLVLWVRSLGHSEVWNLYTLELNPEWSSSHRFEVGTARSYYVRAANSRLWLGTLLEAPTPQRGIPRFGHHRIERPADKAREEFELVFDSSTRDRFGPTQIWRFAGIGLRSECYSENQKYTHLALPFWVLAIVFGIWPVLFVTRRLLRKKRFAAGLCRQCGYDLRATPERCPECGRVVEKGE